MPSKGSPLHPMHDRERAILQHGLSPSHGSGKPTDTRRPQHGDPTDPSGHEVNPGSGPVRQNIAPTYTDYGPEHQKQVP